MRACADDLGAALRKLSILKVLYPIFMLALAAAGLNLKPKKCILVPLIPLTPSTLKHIKAWLLRHLPAWKDFNIRDSGKYLGFFLGPAANASQWFAPLNKYTDRANKIHGSGVAISVAAHTYNTSVVPVPLYVAQLVPLPQEAQKRETNALHKVTHMCTNAIRVTDFFDLQCIGGPKFRSVHLSAAAAIFRTAVVTVPVWPDWKRQLQTAAAEYLSVADVCSNVCSPPFWDSSPLALNLSDAFGGFRGNPKYNKGALNCIAEIAEMRAPEMDFLGGEFVPGAQNRSCAGSVLSSLGNLGSRDAPVFRPGMKAPGLQKSCYSHLLASVFPSDIDTIVSRRIRDMFAPFFVPNFSHSLSSAVLRRMRKHDAMRVFKTWVNSWATSWRMHEPKLLPCVFGCPAGKDQQSHYVMCPILFALQTLLIPDCPSDPTARIGLIDISRQTALVISATFAGYHAIRRSPQLENDAHTYPETLRNRNHKVFVDHFYTAALDAGLQCLHERLVDKRLTPIITADGVCTVNIIEDRSVASPNSAMRLPSRRLPQSISRSSSLQSPRIGATIPAPRPSSGQASVGSFVRAAQPNAHNPFLGVSGVTEAQVGFQGAQGARLYSPGQ